MRYPIICFYLLVFVPILYAGVTLPPPSDTAYGISWDNVTTIAPSKNTVYDKIENLSTTYDSRYLRKDQNDSSSKNYTLTGHHAMGADATVDQDGSSIMLNLNETYTSMPTDSFFDGLDINLTLNPSAHTNAQVIGFNFGIGVDASNTKNFTNALFGGIFGVGHEGSGTITKAEGLNLLIQNWGTGTITETDGLWVTLRNKSTGTITTGRAIYIYAPENSGGGTFANNYGLYIADQSAVGSINSYNIYSLGTNAKNYFQGIVQVDNKLGILETGATPTKYGYFIMPDLTADVNYTLPNTTDTLAVLGGDVWTGIHDFGGATVSVATPTSAAHATTKDYVDNAVGIVVDYFFNDTASDLGGIYYAMADNDLGGAESTLTSAALPAATNNQALFNFASPSAGAGLEELRAGIYDVHFHAEKTSGTSTATIYVEIYSRTSGGTETLRMTTETSSAVTSKAAFNIHAVLASDVTLATTDRLVVKFFANTAAGGNGATIALYQEGTLDSHLSISTTSDILSNIFLRLDGGTLTGTHDFGGATSFEIPNGTADVVLSSAGQIHLNTTDEQLSFHSAADGEISGEASISLLRHITLTFDPSGWYDQETTYRVVPVMYVGDDCPEGFTITEWKLNYVGGDPTTELDCDLICDTTPDFNPAADATVMDVLDTTAGASSADTGFDSATCANGARMYLRFGADPTDANVVVTIDIWGFNEED